METISHAFQSLGDLIEVFSLLVAMAGFYIAFQGFKVAGTMIGVGSGLHALGYSLLTRRDLHVELTSFRSLLINTMYPGLLLLTVGICYLAYLLHRKRGVGA